MKIRVIEDSQLAEVLKVGGITLYPFIFIVCSLEIAKKGYLLRHEFVHVSQVERLGWLRFYLSYLFYFLVNYIKYRNWDKAYRAIPYESEAYRTERWKKLPDYI